MNNTTQKDQAKAGGVHENTLRKYLKDPVFIDLLEKRRKAYITKSVNKMQGCLDLCVDKIIDIIKTPDLAPQIYINACSLLFTQARAWTETVDIMERIKKIEEGL